MLRVVDPSLNATVPVAAEGATVAVRTTFWPGDEDAGATDRVVVVTAGFTVSVTNTDLFAALLPSPLYEACNECKPTFRVDVVMVALPLLSVAEPRELPAGLSRTDTVPVALAGLTAIVRVTVWPETAGFGLAERVTVTIGGVTVSTTAAEVLGL
jgi:hypothetical protein